MQGVFFRAECVRRARELEIGGWVRNALDGRVEAEFEGLHDAVEAMVAWCRQGPSMARVEQVDVREEPPIGETSFRVVR